MLLLRLLLLALLPIHHHFIPVFRDVFLKVSRHQQNISLQNTSKNVALPEQQQHFRPGKVRHCLRLVRFLRRLLSLFWLVVVVVVRVSDPLFLSFSLTLARLDHVCHGLPKQDVSRRPHQNHARNQSVHIIIKGDYLFRGERRRLFVVVAVQNESLRVFLGLRSRTRGLVRLKRVEVLRRIGNEEGFGKRRRRRQTTARRTRRGRDDEDGNGNNTTRIKNRIHI